MLVKASQASLDYFPFIISKYNAYFLNNRKKINYAIKLKVRVLPPIRDLIRPYSY